MGMWRKKITAITGPILKEGLPKLKNGLEIPQDFFKVIIDETPPMKLISFIYHQADKGDVLTKRMWKSDWDFFQK